MYIIILQFKAYYFISVDLPAVKKEDSETRQKDEQESNINPKFAGVDSSNVEFFEDHMKKEKAALDTQENYFSYFVVIAILCIVFYLVFHNKQKVRNMYCTSRFSYVRKSLTNTQYF